jgi:hypothetical protein
MIQHRIFFGGASATKVEPGAAEEGFAANDLNGSNYSITFLTITHN